MSTGRREAAPDGQAEPWSRPGSLAAIDAEIQRVIDDPAASRWLRDGLRSAIDRDAVDATADAQILHELLDLRLNAILLNTVARGHVVLDRDAPLPFRVRRPVHVFDPWTNPDTIAAEIFAHVVAPMEDAFRHLRHVLDAREAKAVALAKASAELTAVLGPAVSDPRDRDGCSHLLHDGQVLGRVRLSRSGSSSLEVNGLDHDTVIAVAALIKTRLGAEAMA